MATVVTKKNSSLKVNNRKDTVVFAKFPEEDYYLIEEFKQLEKGNVALITCWEDVEKVLEGFEDNEDFEIAELTNGIYAVLPSLCVKSARKEYDGFIKIR